MEFDTSSSWISGKLYTPKITYITIYKTCWWHKYYLWSYAIFLMFHLSCYVSCSGISDAIAIWQIIRKIYNSRLSSCFDNQYLGRYIPCIFIGSVRLEVKLYTTMHNRYATNLFRISMFTSPIVVIIGNWRNHSQRCQLLDTFRCTSQTVLIRKLFDYSLWWTLMRQTIWK